jgi:hypothetical protein
VGSERLALFFALVAVVPLVAAFFFAAVFLVGP